MAKKRKHPSTPRHKRLTRQGRLGAAPLWLTKYEGKNLVKGYSKHFAVDLLCALNELTMLGVTFNQEYVAQLKKSVESQIKVKQERKRKRKEQEEIDRYPNSDYYFSFIAGYTAAGFPYGITWEEEEALSHPNPDEQGNPPGEDFADDTAGIPWINAKGRRSHLLRRRLSFFPQRYRVK